jgi:NAD-dependent dihydropyrimidine dehydrogenase PreA subunit
LPVDPDFQKNRKVVYQHEGHDVWGPYVPPQEQGVHGTDVAVDWDLCSGDAICVNVCPANVFEMAPAPDHPVSDQKSDPVRQKDCIQCLACQTQCPVQAIKVST